MYNATIKHQNEKKKKGNKGCVLMVGVTAFVLLGGGGFAIALLLYHH